MEKTRASLLLRVRDRRDQQSWRQFEQFYGPMIHRWLLRLQVRPADAPDLTQDLMLIVMNHICTGKFQYDPDRSFRAWLKTVTRNRVKCYFRERNRKPAGRGGTDNLAVLQQLASDESEDDDPFEREWRERCLQIAAEHARRRVAPRTWEAFQRLVDGVKPDEAARQMGMTVGNVYVIWARIKKMLCEEVEEICGGDR